MTDKNPGTTCQIVDGKAYYTVIWSPITKIDKYVILNKVPAMPGIFELYCQDDYKNLYCFYFSRVWYGGLRSSLREVTDPLVVTDQRRKEVLESRECYFRYTIVNSFADMRDLMNMLGLKRVPPEYVPPDSERYEEMYLKEETPDKLISY